MKELVLALWFSLSTALTPLAAPLIVGNPPLDLTGYADASGAISVQHQGDTVDPYFALQALLLAHSHGLDVSEVAMAWGRWLLPRQKPDATFDRFCRQGPVWAACKTADADDSLLGLWMAFIDTLPLAVSQHPDWVKSRSAAQAALARLVDPSRGIYLVSPVYQHGLFMDNLELWSHDFTHPAVQSRSRPSYTQSIRSVFWDRERQRYLVSTQPGQRETVHAFYPDAVAQIFPLLVRFSPVPGGAGPYYRRWMAEHRKEWLSQVHDDFAWGLIAIVALEQNDMASARCWLRITLPYRHSSHWTVTDEVVAQVLQARAVTAHPDINACPQVPRTNQIPKTP
jgi:hypothetical protein